MEIVNHKRSTPFANEQRLTSFCVPHLGLAFKRHDLLPLAIQIFIIDCVIRCLREYGEQLRIQAAAATKAHRRREIKRDERLYEQKGEATRRVEALGFIHNPVFPHFPRSA